MCLFHLFELAATLNPRVLVFPLTFTHDTFCFLNIVIDVTLNTVAHLFDFARDPYLILGVDLFLLEFLVTETIFMLLVNLVAFDLFSVELREVYFLFRFLDVILSWFFDNWGSNLSFFSLTLFDSMIDCKIIVGKIID